MSFLKYIFRSLWFYRKQHLALFAGTVISTAVLTGALIVGDSVRYSLKNLVDLRLGNTGYVLQTGDRFVTAGLAGRLSDKLDAGVLALNIVNGIGVNPDSGLQVNNLQVLGIDNNFQNFFQVEIPPLTGDQVLVSRNLASRLKLVPGSNLILRTEDISVIPLNAPFSRDAAPSVGLRLTVKGILEKEQMGRFSLKNNQAAPLNLFINREYLGDKLGIPGLVNTLLVSRDADPLTPADMNEHMRQACRLADYGVHIKTLRRLGRYEVVSTRIFIDNPVSEAIQEVDADKEEVLTYLVNSIRFHDRITPYSFVTAATPPYVEDPLGNHEIVISRWLAEDLAAGIGDSIDLEYFVVGPLRNLRENRSRFVIKSIIDAGALLIDSTLMPEYPGLSEAGNCRDWDAGIPIDLKKIRDKDEFYWDDYRGTPKALVSMQEGQELWANEFGNTTAFRFDTADISSVNLEQALLSALDPAGLNLVFSQERREGMSAADNSVDFGELFLSLSFFVIAAGMLLTILLFGLQTKSRMPEAGILSALGFSRGKIMLFRFSESALIALLGGVAGAFLGLFYNKAVMAGLNSVWQDAVRSDMLEIHLFTGTIGTGALIGFVLGIATIFLVLYFLLKQPVAGILKDFSVIRPKTTGRRKAAGLFFMVVAFAGSAGLMVFSLLSDVDGSAALFLSAGTLFMAGGLAWLGRYFSGAGIKEGVGTYGILRLSMRNTVRNKSRSLTTVALLALGTFTIIITGANRKTFYGAENDRHSGTGGFLFWIETTLPVNDDISSLAVREKLGIADEHTLANARILQFLTLDGDDASCLNLNQVQQPRVLGVDPEEFASRQAFSFDKLMSGVSRDNPWTELKKDYPGRVIPAFADQTVITWGLKKKVGDTLYYRNENGETISLLLVGGLSNSIFQGNILIDQERFRNNFPSVSGSRVMLLDAPAENADEISLILQSRLSDVGIDLSRASRRLAEFNSVENTYLAVFMLLGGLGVIIGTIGLGVVIVRNLMDRKEELALLAAVGFDRSLLLKLILSENIALLLSGLFLGITGALIGIMPSLLSPSFAIPGAFMIWLVAGVFLSGLVWIWIPAFRMMRRSLLKALRNE